MGMRERPHPKAATHVQVMIFLRISLIFTLSGCALQVHQYEDGFRDRIRSCASVFECRRSSW